ncbi:MAG: bifunctional homocysteine S-methyltransferase/methylenetetrahydrofolate reductase [bacterium]|nr:bifunctional homocysteine S-methyltransferase/methylenetetrahydrofolate reductase [bacterium]
MFEKITLHDYLEKNVLITDGAMGTYYAYLKKDDGAVSELANLAEPEMIEQIHREYIMAGAKMIRTNTFAANRFSLGVSGEERGSMIQAACKIARKAVSEQKEQVFIAGSIGPIPEFSAHSEEEIMDEYKAMIDGLLNGGVDLIVFETFPDLYYIKELLPYIRQKQDLFIMANFCLNKNGYTKSGFSAKRLMEEANELKEIDCFGFNCGVGSGHMKAILEKLPLKIEKKVAIIPNAGYPEQMHNRMFFRDNAEYFRENMIAIKEYGINVLGGCCGTMPNYIHAIADSLDLKVSQNHKAVHMEEDKLYTLQQHHTNEFYQLFDKKRKVIAVELDPPYDANYDKLIEQAQTLKHRGVDILTMADSPMGRSRVDSILMSVKIASEVGIHVMPHVCCRDKNMIAMRSGLLGAYINDIRNLLVVTGDPVPSDSRTSVSSVFDYNSIRLMQFVKEMNEEHFKEDPIYYGGALNYARGNVDKVIERMNKKIAAGCKYFLTQPVYSEEDIVRLRYIRSKVDTKLLCGIMPFVSYRNANFVKNEFFGIDVPDEILNRYRPDMSKQEAEAVGAQLANELIEKTKDFADGYYFMLPFNRVSLLEKIHIEKL